MLLDQINQSIQQAILELLATDAWRQYEGETTHRLAGELGQIFQAEHVSLCSSGTAALEIILRAANIATHDEVLLAAYDYPGTFWAIERVGARPVLLDIDPSGWSLNVEQLESAHQSSCRALIVSHLHGQLQPIDQIRQWCDQKKVLLIEDACQAVGANFQGRPIGGWGDASFISFGGGKVLSAGRGGAWLTNDSSLAQRARIAAGAGSGPYALSQLQAAAVIAQLGYLDAINRHCRTFFGSLNDELLHLDATLSFPSMIHLQQTAFYQAGWLLPLQNQPPTADVDYGTAQQFVATLAAHGIPAGVGFPGFFRRSSRRCRTSNNVPNARSAATRTVVLHHRLAMDERLSVSVVAAAIHRSLENHDNRGGR